MFGDSESKIVTERIDEIIRFEQLLSHISARYINLPATDIEQYIQNDLGRIGSFLEVDRCIFYLPSKRKGLFEVRVPFNWWPEKDHEIVTRISEWVQSEPDFFERLSYIFNKWLQGEVVKLTNLDELPPEAARVKEVFDRFQIKSHLGVPISVAGKIVGALAIGTIHSHRTWDDNLIARLRLVGEVFANALKRKQTEVALQNAFLEIKRLKKQVEADYMYLREEIKLVHNHEEIIGQSDALRYMLFKVEQVAPTDSTVLIQGETGTGKELIARAIHNASRRKDRPLIKVNCAALSPTLIESELFGHEKGAFTGAETRRVGRFELADGATLFLDEICELPLELQPKLLRVLQEGEFERVGGSQTLEVDIRVIAATNRDIKKEMEIGRFRTDLWYRLNTFPITVPPLRKRSEDIPLFISWFVQKYANKVGKRFDSIPQKVINSLKRYTWPGNIRELENVVERAVITSRENNLLLKVPLESYTWPDNCGTLAEINREHILKTLEESGWKIEGKYGAARILGLKPSTLRHRMKKLHIIRPAPKSIGSHR
jgi:transcriptional regulator with GAF, ATPase, and Fis domain